MSVAICVPKSKLETAVIKVSDALATGNCKKNDWKSFSEKQLWLELVSCILGSRVPFETAKSCVQHLEKTGLLSIKFLIQHQKQAERTITKELKKPVYQYPNQRFGKYRFPNSKAKCIVKTCVSIYKEKKSTIRGILSKCDSSHEARLALVEVCCGVGIKQASLFLRNISYCDDLAIIDSHVAKYMELIGLTESNNLVKHFDSNHYINKEQILQEYSNKLNKSLAALDVGIWVVMRVASREVAYENNNLGFGRN